LERSSSLESTNTGLKLKASKSNFGDPSTLFKNGLKSKVVVFPITELVLLSFSLETFTFVDVFEVDLHVEDVFKSSVLDLAEVLTGSLKLDVLFIPPQGSLFGSSSTETVGRQLWVS